MHRRPRSGSESYVGLGLENARDDPADIDDVCSNRHVGGNVEVENLTHLDGYVRLHHDRRTVEVNHKCVEHVYLSPDIPGSLTLLRRCGQQIGARHVGEL